MLLLSNEAILGRRASGRAVTTGVANEGSDKTCCLALLLKRSKDLLFDTLGMTGITAPNLWNDGCLDQGQRFGTSGKLSEAGVCTEKRELKTK